MIFLPHSYYYALRFLSLGEHYDMASFPPIMVVAVPSSSGGNKEWLLEATHRRYTMNSDLALTSSLEFTQHVVSIEPLAA